MLMRLALELHSQCASAERVVLLEHGNSLHFLLRNQLDSQSELHGVDRDIARIVDEQPVKRQQVSVEVLTLRWDEGILDYPVDPGEHQEIARTSVLAGLSENSLAEQVQLQDAAVGRVDHHPVLMVDAQPHLYR